MVQIQTTLQNIMAIGNTSSKNSKSVNRYLNRRINELEQIFFHNSIQLQRKYWGKSHENLPEKNSQN